MIRLATESAAPSNSAMPLRRYEVFADITTNLLYSRQPAIAWPSWDREWNSVLHSTAATVAGGASRRRLTMSSRMSQSRWDACRDVTASRYNYTLTPWGHFAMLGARLLPSACGIAAR